MAAWQLSVSIAGPALVVAAQRSRRGPSARGLARRRHVCGACVGGTGRARAQRSCRAVLRQERPDGGRRSERQSIADANDETDRRTACIVEQGWEKLFKQGARIVSTRRAAPPTLGLGAERARQIRRDAHRRAVVVVRVVGGNRGTRGRRAGHRAHVPVLSGNRHTRARARHARADRQGRRRTGHRDAAGFTVAPVRPWACNTKYTLEPCDVQLLSEPMLLAPVVLGARAPVGAQWCSSGETTVAAAGTLDGLCGWFSAELTPGVAITNNPVSRDRIQRRIAVIPMDGTATIDTGDRVSIDLVIDPAQSTLSWRVRLTRGGEVVYTSNGSTLPGMALATRRTRTRQPPLTLARPSLPSRNHSSSPSPPSFPLARLSRYARINSSISPSSTRSGSPT